MSHTVQNRFFRMLSSSYRGKKFHAKIINYCQLTTDLTVKGRAVPNPVNIHLKFEQKLKVSSKARAWMIVQVNRPSNSSA